MITNICKLSKMWSKSYDRKYVNSNNYFIENDIKLPNHHDVNNKASNLNKSFYSRRDTVRRETKDEACAIDHIPLKEEFSKSFVCFCCQRVILNQILCAVGRTYHAECFVCHKCQEYLDGKLFGVDEDGHVLCQDHYIQTNSPMCALCDKVIVPIEETGEIVRVVAMGREFHIDCYKCEDCGIHLTDESDKRCYPLGDLLLCYFCHRDRKKPHRKVAGSTVPGFFNPNIAKLKGHSTDVGIDKNADYVIHASFI